MLGEYIRANGLVKEGQEIADAFPQDEEGDISTRVIKSVLLLMH